MAHHVLVRALLAVFALPLMPANLHAQTDDEPVQEPIAVPVAGDLPEGGEVFTIVEEMPSFPGGQEELFKYLAGHVRYPAQAIEAGIQGVVYVTFVVGKDGAIGEAKVLRGIGGGCDEEALRVVKAMPPWEPGRQRGKAVLVRYNIPIRFTLDEPKEGQ